LANNLSDIEVLKEEKKKEKLAKYVFNFSSPYFTADHNSTPHAHHQIKQLIEHYTNNKVYVKILDGGINGIGSSLANLVSFGMSQGALLSMSNLAPKVPEIDIINIPYWAASNQDYLRLMKSEVFNKYILSNLRKYNLEMLFPYVTGGRTATSTKKYSKLIIEPEDFKGLTVRVPGSLMLKKMYTIAGASPMSIDWSFTSKAANAGRYQALDPSIIGLYSGPDKLKYQLGVISEINSVQDAWIAIGNSEFIEHLDTKTRSQLFEAFSAIQIEQQRLQQESRLYCINEFKKIGVRVYTPTATEIKTLSDAIGHNNPLWKPVKKSLLGENGLKIFDEMYRAAKG